MILIRNCRPCGSFVFTLQDQPAVHFVATAQSTLYTAVLVHVDSAIDKTLVGRSALVVPVGGESMLDAAERGALGILRAQIVAEAIADHIAPARPHSFLRTCAIIVATAVVLSMLLVLAAVVRQDAVPNPALVGFTLVIICVATALLL